MKLRRSTAVSLAAALAAAIAVSSGCASLEVSGTVEYEPEESGASKHARRAANEAASLAKVDDELDESAGEQRDNMDAAMANASDADPPSDHMRERDRDALARARRKPQPRTTSKFDAADSEIDEPPEDTFEEVIAEARRSGGLTAADEAVFRRDLAAIPPTLRPQMAQMLLAMKHRDEPKSSEHQRNEHRYRGPPTNESKFSDLKNDQADASLRREWPDASRVQARALAAKGPTGRNEPGTGLTNAASAMKYGDRDATSMALSALADNPLRTTTEGAASNELLAAAMSAQRRAGDRVAGVGAGNFAGDNLAHGAGPTNVPAEVGGRGRVIRASAETDAANPRELPRDVSRDDRTRLQSSADEADVEGKDNATGKSHAAQQSNEEWRVMLAATIRTLEDDLALAAEKGETGGTDAAQRQAFLRMMYLIANRRDDALQPVSGADAREQKFWIDWLYGTSVYLDVNTTASDGQRATVAASRLREAVQRLGEQANLEIGSLAFCKRVTSFGVYETFSETDKPSIDPKSPAKSVSHPAFGPNQEVLLYAEVRNFTSKPGPKGYHTFLRPSYQIFDAQGRRIGSVVELDESHDYCQQRRNDFFVCYHIYLPTRIDSGDYKLKLTIEDAQAGKVRESSIDFAIRTP